MSDTVDRAGLKVARTLAEFVETKVAPDLGLSIDAFWQGAADIFARFTPRNRDLLQKRETLQEQIDAWHGESPGVPDPEAYEAFLREIGYLVPEPAPFEITTDHVDPELSALAGPQLVVPVLNARYALNAANARWGSLYDAFYGTDAIPLTGDEKPGYDPARGSKVIERAKSFLNDAVPLANGSHGAATSYTVVDGTLEPTLADPGQFVGYTGAPEAPKTILLKNNGLHIEIIIDRNHPVGKDDQAGVADIVLESALSTIVDLEDSVAAVDAEDKTLAYRNWLGLMRGDLEASFQKGGSTVTRGLNPDRTYTAPSGDTFTLKGRAALLVRNVGHLMTTPAVHLSDGSEAFEGILDAIVTSLIACHDLKGIGPHRNSVEGSVFI
ncbi:MAG: malate synthase G, partial [Pseudomonadota bacterium]